MPSDVPVATSEAIEARFREEPGALLERVAEEFGVTPLEAAHHLPPEHCTLVDGATLPDVLEELSRWGEVMFLVHLPAFIVEVKTSIPAVKAGRGYLNFQGGAPLGGHLREDACEAIAFLDRPFMGRRSCAALFFDEAGDCIFKVFVGREADRSLKADQLENFERLRKGLARSL
ncbi:MAG: heme utilization cystosolic carrier protein HutX [Pseudomonadota bacterium]